jgi:hypothetical protein
MSDPSQPLSSLEVELVGLLDEHDRLGSHADDVASRVLLARAWLQELEQKAARLQASAQTATAAERQELKQIKQVKIKDCEDIMSKYDAIEAERARARCTLVIPADGAVYRLNVKRDDNRLKDVQIRRARFVGGVGQPGTRFAVASMEHTVLSERLECSAVYAGCELHAVAASEPDPPAFVTVCSVEECAGVADHFDVVVSVEKVRLLPPAHAFGDVQNGEVSVAMMERRDFQYWQRLELASAECGGWSEGQLKAWFDTSKIER